MFTGRDYLVEAERRKNEAAQAAQARLSRQVPDLDRPAVNGGQRLMARLARLWVAWNSQLRTDYTPRSRTSTSTG